MGILAFFSSAKRHQARLQMIAEIIAGVATSNGATGRRDGLVTAIRFVARDDTGSTSVPWTYVEVELPAAHPLSIHVRRHALGDRRSIRRGDMVDIELGDPEFDRTFLVEAAPSEVVADILDAQTVNTF